MSLCRVAADVLGHASTSTTLHHCITRNTLHPEVTDLVPRAVTGAETTMCKNGH